MLDSLRPWPLSECNMLHFFRGFTNSSVFPSITELEVSLTKAETDSAELRSTLTAEIKARDLANAKLAFVRGELEVALALSSSRMSRTESAQLEMNMIAARVERDEALSRVVAL